MIVFDLVCKPSEHRFEGWFASSDSFADQRARSLLMCPTCGSVSVDKDIMAPRVGRKGNQVAAHSPGDAIGSSIAPCPSAAGPQPNGNPNDPRSAAIAAMVAKVAAVQADKLPQSTWVGGDFAAQARAMHDGKIDPGLIHGQASADEARALHDDGVAIMPLLCPIVPPELQN